MSLLLVQRVLPDLPGFPSNPYSGLTFVNQRTNRNYEYTYEGGLWIPKMSYGAATLYVDPVAGTNDQSHGIGIGALAYRTMNYALEQIPPRLTMPATVNFTGTIAESLLLLPKFGAHVVIQGSLGPPTHLVATGGTAGVAAGAMATVTGAFGVGAHNNKLIHFTSGLNNDYWGVVSQTTAGTLYIVGILLPAGPANGDTYDIVDWADTIQGHIDCRGNYQGALTPSGVEFPSSPYVIKYCAITDSPATPRFEILWGSYGLINFKGCKITNPNNNVTWLVNADNQSLLAFWSCYIENMGAAAAGVGIASWQGQIDWDNSKIKSLDGAQGVVPATGGIITSQGSEFQDGANIWWASQNGYGALFGGSAATYIHGAAARGVNASQNSSCTPFAAGVIYGQFPNGAADPNVAGNTLADASSYIG